MRRFIDILEAATSQQVVETPSEKFLKDFTKASEAHPSDPHSRMMGSTEVMAVPANVNPDSTIYIADLLAMEPGKGHAKAVLKALCGLADKYGVTLTLIAKAYGEGGLTTKQLIDWYGRAGFTVTQRGGGGFNTNMARKPHHALEAKPLDENDEMPKVVYHGTTLDAWEGDEGEGVMYFTSNRDDASNYAEEAAVAEHHRNGFDSDSATIDETIKPIVVTFNLEDLTKLTDHGAELQPDWGWLDGHHYAEGDQPTWVESFQHVGSFCIAPFKHEFKALGTISSTLNEDFAGGDVLDGWWIDEHGRMHECDHRKDWHHADIAMDEFDIEDEDGEDAEGDDDYLRDHAIQTAFDEGWVRASAYSGVLSIHWERPLVEATKRALLRWVDTYGPSFKEIIVQTPNGTYQNFTDSRQASRAIRTAIASAS